MFKSDVIETKIEIERQGEKKTKRARETERQKYRETEKRETERQRDKRNRETHRMNFDILVEIS